MEVLTLLERERNKLIRERDLIKKLLESPNFENLNKRDNPRPENYGLELGRLSSLIQAYETAIINLEKPMEIKFEPGSIITNCLGFTYSTCVLWEGIEEYIAMDKDGKPYLYLAIPLNHPWYKEPEFSEKPLSCIRIGKWALYQMKIRNYKDKKKQKTHSSLIPSKFIAEAVYAKGYREK